MKSWFPKFSARNDLFIRSNNDPFCFTGSSLPVQRLLTCSSSIATCCCAMAMAIECCGQHGCLSNTWWTSLATRSSCLLVRLSAMKETKLSLLSYACWGIIKGINLEGTIGKEQLDIQKALRHCCTHRLEKAHGSITMIIQCTTLNFAQNNDVGKNWLKNAFNLAIDCSIMPTKA